MQKMTQSLSQLVLDKFVRARQTPAQRVAELSELHNGNPFVVDDGNLRFMYFDQNSVQSVMRIDAPEELLFGYTRAMMSFLFLNPAPSHILMVGLGGGSLVKFCHRFLPACKITVLEIDPGVIALRKQFCVPDDDERLSIKCCDAASYIAEVPDLVDVILLDGFDINGLVQSLCSPKFLAQCYDALSVNGILVCNMWGKQRELIPHLRQLRQIFDQNVWWGRSPDSYNLVVFANKNLRAKFPVEGAINPVFFTPEMAFELQQFNYALRDFRDPTEKGTTNADAADLEYLALEADLAFLLGQDPSLPRSEEAWRDTHHIKSEPGKSPT